ncbi:ROK family protein [Aestuariivirga sp. YIM B02566]|uniref:ROK family protein n=2 Tax=Taklimakanibacter albus TaxID=2800327 RepID=A0ACC5R854_9HYPH|nr:ROK family protein [Aestuariivirga sp. YIM B02566]
MRFAPPNPLRIADRAAGLNATSVRSYNERLLLSLLLQNDGITRLEIGESTGLSAQTVSVLVRSLEQEGLVMKGKVQKGRVGPPTTPVVLNPEGAYSVGISIGSKRAHIVLIDFVGAVRFHATLPNPEPNSKSNHPEFLETIQRALEVLPPGTQDRLAGIGLALPESRSGLTAGKSDPKHRYAALQEEIEKEIGQAVFVQNDITAAAAGESMFGSAKPHADYLYFYLGHELHSRLVLNHQIYNSNSPLSFDIGLGALERLAGGKGLPTEPLWDRADLLLTWENDLIASMRSSITALAQFVEVRTVILSSYIPEDVCQALCAKLGTVLPGVTVIAGKLSPSPKAVGAAGLPFSSRFMVE